jgi:hypothetical protein
MIQKSVTNSWGEDPLVDVAQTIHLPQTILALVRRSFVRFEKKRHVLKQRRTPTVTSSGMIQASSSSNQTMIAKIENENEYNVTTKERNLIVKFWSDVSMVVVRAATHGFGFTRTPRRTVWYA